MEGRKEERKIKTARSSANLAAGRSDTHHIGKPLIELNLVGRLIVNIMSIKHFYG